MGSMLISMRGNLALTPQISGLGPQALWHLHGLNEEGWVACWHCVPPPAESILVICRI